MKRPVDAGVGAGLGGASFQDETFVSEFPELYHHLTDTTWDDGSPRETMTLLLVVDAGCLKAWLNDRALRRSAWVTAATFQGLFRLIEASLREDTLGWRVEKVQQRKR